MHQEIWQGALMALCCNTDILSIFVGHRSDLYNILQYRVLAHRATTYCWLEEIWQGASSAIYVINFCWTQAWSTYDILQCRLRARNLARRPDGLLLKPTHIVWLGLICTCSDLCNILQWRVSVIECRKSDKVPWWSSAPSFDDLSMPPLHCL